MSERGRPFGDPIKEGPEWDAYVWETTRMLDAMEADAVRRGLWTPDWRKNAEARHEAHRYADVAREALLRQGRELPDAWLEAAANELGMYLTAESGAFVMYDSVAEGIIAVLRRHRDAATPSPAPSAPADEAPPQG